MELITVVQRVSLEAWPGVLIAGSAAGGTR